MENCDNLPLFETSEWNIYHHLSDGKGEWRILQTQDELKPYRNHDYRFIKITNQTEFESFKYFIYTCEEMPSKLILTVDKVTNKKIYYIRKKYPVIHWKYKKTVQNSLIKQLISLFKNINYAKN